MVTLTTSPEKREKTGQQGEMVPPLYNGDHLTRAEFERRYQAQPELKKAELIEGVVYVPSPVHIQTHAEPHIIIAGWLLNYTAATPGVRAADNGTTILDWDNEVQPDAMLRLDEKTGGQSRINKDDYLEGAPEFVVEIAATSASYDLNNKREVYRRSGVKEYLVLATYEQETFWHVLEEGIFRLLSSDENGVLKSRTFPGLYFHPEYFWANNLAGLLNVLHQGINSAEHADFVRHLQQLV